MTERVDRFHELPSGDAIVAPRLPTFDPSDAAPESGASAPRAADVAARAEMDGMGACLAVVVDGVLFAGLFGLYATLHAAHPEVFRHGRYFLNPVLGAAANSVLIASCLAAALSARFARLGDARRLVASLSATILFAGFFLGVQGAEYSETVERGLLPGRYYSSTEPVWRTARFRREHPRAAEYAERFRLGDPARSDEPGASPVAVEPLVRAGALGSRAVLPTLPSEPRNAHVFFGTYYLFSGLLALHVLAGAGVWTWLLSRVRRSAETRSSEGVECAALYWNFIAIVRVLVFPLFYLVH